MDHLMEIQPLNAAVTRRCRSAATASRVADVRYAGETSETLESLSGESQVLTHTSGYPR